MAFHKARSRPTPASYQELISRIENGAANPELVTLGKIADALGVHPRSYWRNDAAANGGRPRCKP
jgi:hypothetical protein